MGWKIMQIQPTKNPSNNSVLFEPNTTRLLTIQARGRSKRPSDSIMCKNRCVTLPSRPFITWWGSK